MKEKEIIENSYGLLWSGGDNVLINGKEVTAKDILKAFDISLEDAVPIDILQVDGDRYAVRFYDGDDRRIVVMEFNSALSIKKEYRAHIAEWLTDDVYMKIGTDAFMCYDLISAFHKFYTDIYLKEGNVQNGELLSQGD